MVVASSKVIADRLDESILMDFFLLEKVSLLVDPAVIVFLAGCFAAESSLI